MSAAPAITIDGAAKRFTISHRKTSGLKERLIARVLGRRDEREEFWALDDVSLTVAPGDTLGVVGPNGAGKSTLLQLVAGILEPDRGRVSVGGRVTSLLELGAGFSPDLSGRENVFLNASLHGVSRAATARSFDAIVAFAELERFIDTPVRNYSSGMYMRLGFAVAVHLDPEIILVDEAFAVGDERFQRKCLRKLKDFQEKGVTIILVSHDLSLVDQFASRGCLLVAGRVAALGTPSEVIARYHAVSAGTVGLAEARRWGTREAEVDGVEFLRADGRPAETMVTRDPLTIRIRYRAPAPIPHPVVGLAIYTEGGIHLTGPNTKMCGFPIDRLEGQGAIDYRIERLPLLPGRYLVSASIYDRDLVMPFDHRDRFAAFTVIEGGTAERFGLLELAARWALVPGAESRR